MNRTVGDVMTTDVVVARPDTPFKDIVRLLEDHRISAVPIVDDSGRPVGVVSEGDLLLKEEFASGETERRRWPSRRERGDQAKAEGIVAADIMAAPAITTTRDVSLSTAARLMHAHRVKRLPVVGFLGAVEGIVSRADLLKVFLRRDDEIRREVSDDVLSRTMWIEPDTVRVTVRNGVVTLRGRLEHKSHIPVVLGFVRRLDGVVAVEDQLTSEIDDTNLRSGLLVPRWSGFGAS